MTDADQPLDAIRVMELVAGAMESAMLGMSSVDAAAQLVQAKQPSLRELAAARRENFEVHGAGTPDILRELGMAPSPVPPEVLRMRTAIDDVLTAAERQMEA
ncbi:MAG: hypothetical protein QOJ79_552 [Actinomycetota bacterium]|jgi:hypothetical protein|nr:hypothetical protein [Actinomycetota bacterium]